MTNFFEDGFYLKRGLIPQRYICAIEEELLSIAHLIDPSKTFTTLDDCWNYHKLTSRTRAAKIYNAFKHLHSVKRLAMCEELQSFLFNELKISSPALVDINCRIDSNGEEKYLFGWHQDYWFSVCSPKAVVIWVPISGLSSENGGLEVISNKYTDSRIFKTKANTEFYNSYADAILIDEEVNHFPTTTITEMKIGDGLCFSFNLLHKSLPVSSHKKSRFTIQLRFADFEDSKFMENDFKPGVVNRNTIDYLIRS